MDSRNVVPLRAFRWDYTPQEDVLRWKGDPMRLIPGMVAMLACVGLGILNVQGYLRHLDTGDQAGFALGTFFLVGWLLPGTAVALLIGAIGFPHSETPREAGIPRGIAAAALIAGAVFFLAYGVWMTLTFGPSRHSGAQSLEGVATIATIFAFSVNVLACVLALRPKTASTGDGKRPWLSGLTLAISAVVVFELIGLLSSGVLAQALPIYLPLILGPTLLWFAALLWSAWALSKRLPQHG